MHTFIYIKRKKTIKELDISKKCIDIIKSYLLQAKLSISVLKSLTLLCNASLRVLILHISIHFFTDIYPYSFIVFSFF